MLSPLLNCFEFTCDIVSYLLLSHRLKILCADRDYTFRELRVIKSKALEGGRGDVDQEYYFCFCFVLQVEGGRIDHAHHENVAKIALEEVVAFDKAIEVGLNLTKEEETIIVVTADHSHSMSINGYPKRGNPIEGDIKQTWLSVFIIVISRVVFSSSREKKV